MLLPFQRVYPEFRITALEREQLRRPTRQPLPFCPGDAAICHGDAPPLAETRALASTKGSSVGAVHQTAGVLVRSGDVRERLLDAYERVLRLAF